MVFLCVHGYQAFCSRPLASQERIRENAKISFLIAAHPKHLREIKVSRTRSFQLRNLFTLFRMLFYCMSHNRLQIFPKTEEGQGIGVALGLHKFLFWGLNTNQSRLYKILDTVWLCACVKVYAKRLHFNFLATIEANHFQRHFRPSTPIAKAYSILR